MILDILHKQDRPSNEGMGFQNVFHPKFTNKRFGNGEERGTTDNQALNGRTEFSLGTEW